MPRLRFSYLTVVTWTILNLPTCLGQTLDEIEEANRKLQSIHGSEEPKRVDLAALFRPGPMAAGAAAPPPSICDTPIPPTCSKSEKYRSIDGSCNNLDNPRWGIAPTEQLRLLPPVYNDGLNEPRTKDKDGNNLPSPRLISNVVHAAEVTSKFHRTHSEMVMLFGQFLDHDITITPVLKGAKCCINPKHEICFNIPIPPDDEIYSNSACKPRPSMRFERSVPTVPRGCPQAAAEPRQQKNDITSYIDGSAVYGSTIAKMDELRARSGGRLKIKGENLLPENPDPTNICSTNNTEDYCVNAGDIRVMEVPLLTSIHTVFMREHNRIARKLSTINPQWTDETIFQEARRIVIGEIQHVTYKEYLAVVLGKARTRRLGLRPQWRGHRDTYDPTIDATMANVFSTAAFRFGHSQIPKSVKKMDGFYEEIESQKLNVTFLSPRTYFRNVDNVLGTDGLIRSSVKERGYRADRILENSVRNHLFELLDLAALNIQRGRDHGLPPYNDWREFCGLPKVTTWRRGKGGFTNHSTSVIALLKKVYRHPDDIDLFTAGISEKHIPHAVVGPTFACILIKHFEKMKNGDRFFYERRGQPDPNGVGNTVKTGFRRKQLNQIKKISLSKIICENMASDEIPPNAFKKLDFNKNKVIKCSEMRDINFEHWRESA